MNVLLMGAYIYNALCNGLVESIKNDSHAHVQAEAAVECHTGD